MKCRAISIDDFTAKYVTMYPHRDAKDILRRLSMALEDYLSGIKCYCGNDLWVIGSAFQGNTCFSCMMGREFSEQDLELEGATEKAPPVDEDLADEDFVPEVWGYFHDDGTPWNPDLHPKPALCLSCKKNDNQYHEVHCNLRRLGQEKEEVFECFVYEP